MYIHTYTRAMWMARPGLVQHHITHTHAHAHSHTHTHAHARTLYRILPRERATDGGGRDGGGVRWWWWWRTGAAATAATAEEEELHSRLCVRMAYIYVQHTYIRARARTHTLL